MDPLSLAPRTPEQVALALQTPSSLRHLLVLDVRPNGQFCGGHILGAENLNFSNILLRRLLKGVVRLETMLTSPELVERVCRRRLTTQLLLCDAGSSAAHRRPELLKHAEVFVNCLRERDAKEGLEHGYSVHYVEGVLVWGGTQVWGREREMRLSLNSHSLGAARGRLRHGSRQLCSPRFSHSV